MSDEKVNSLFGFGEASQLKIDLNEGVASLFQAKESYFQPHVCLNEDKGVEVLRKIAENPGMADTSCLIDHKSIIYGKDIWLNVSFFILLKSNVRPDGSYSAPSVNLTPRQTAYVVQSMPAESQVIVLEKIKKWYLEKFLIETKKGLQTITEQFEKGDPLLKSDDGNRIFDIHGKRPIGDVPYTEWSIAGDNMFSSVFFGITFLDHGQDGYSRIDEILNEIDKKRKSTANSFLELSRALR